MVNWEDFWSWTVAIIFILAFAFFLINVGWQISIMPSGEETCTARCESYDYEYEDYESGGWSPEECWCRDVVNNKPVRVS